MDAAPFGPVRPTKQFVLCFDGTGNKFAGDESDSNVLKIFRMLDRSKPHQFHYYQPGIGTYVTTNTLSHTSRFQRIKSAYQKAKDSAVGSSFDEHVMGGYKFLMRFYNPGDEIYFIGFSRGAYIARFLSEMLDFVGLLEAGNEELTRFAWKTFAKWQQRRGDSEEDKEEKKKLFRFMKAFRETFSRPITRIRFMGLFDTVNSVPRFESAWMQRSKFPYTARSSAKVIRHAVGIDERRAKFRQDLISEIKPWSKKKQVHHQWAHQHLHLHHSRRSNGRDHVPEIVLNDDQDIKDKDNGADDAGHRDQEDRSSLYRSARASGESLQPGDRYRAASPTSPNRRKPSLAVPMLTASTEDLNSIRSGHSAVSLHVPMEPRIAEDDDGYKQDIQEVWFPGGHADIGGGWTLGDGESWPLSHAPLVWMVQEAQRAGLEFDPAKLKQFECMEEFEGAYSPIRENIKWQKSWCRDPAHDRGQDGAKEKEKDVVSEGANGERKQPSSSSQQFRAALYASSTEGLLHDCLAFGNGLPPLSVITWKLMEYLPFRRMDLQENGSWKPIRWPLPCGEVRDIPNDARIHVSAIRRMKKDPNYRPGNLIMGGGGRGVRRAPEEYGIGEWVVKDHEGDPVREIYVRKSACNVCKDDHN
ncbi:T6SS phospholipase effector Tle1-like catalytic domain-containing protein [Aspergillus lucknowensis]|uniref:T6SS Phospholipase effector Tle1-like catalytic domain-containing protein n=1 Tax=Aspergillus lucknowensis TaxID=176173 RepID=A0ABR4LVF8_9EURO